MRRLLLGACLLVGCNDVPVVPPAPSMLQVVSGDGQTGVPGYLLANPVAVRLLDEHGNPVAGDTVEFTLADTTGILGHWVFNSAGPYGVAHVVTDSQGLAQTTWRLGEALGTQQLSARALTVPTLRTAALSATVVSNLATSIDGSAAGLCAIDGQRRLGCWLPPRNDGGVVSPRFVPVATSVQFTQVVVTTYGLALPQGCALATTGRPWCFTLDAQASVTGLAELAGSYPALFTITGAGDGASGTSYCGLAAGGEAWCWGANRWGQLGDGTQVAHASPATVATAARFAQIDVGGEHACAVTAAGDAWCWGTNRFFESGQANTSQQVTVPTQVVTTQRFSRVLAADVDGPVSCAIGTDAALYCWGSVESLTNQGGAAQTGTPVVVAGVTGLIGLTETSGSVFLLTNTARLVATSAGGAPFVWQASGVVRDLSSSHSAHFLCGTSLDGHGTLCQRMFVSDVGPFNLPPVVGVPMP